ncbi:DNA recombination protein RmuC [Chryseolinea sp. H1M3-3]|uniref:DNA recombination protein RmuC n=1 Tax=Chryseolinea sp. H1M3-3 TaxID=3034144 RepID=UPI0023EADB97|nr:DNA recombination protein RmuC [Chryseolinea sp. H1M3-3]
MTIIHIFLIIVILMLLLILWIIIKAKDKTEYVDLRTEVAKVASDLSKLDPLLRNEFSRNREEIQKNSRDSREELSNSFRNLGTGLQTSFRDTKEDLSKSLKSFEERFSLGVREFNELQKQKFDDLINKQHQLKSEVEVRLDKIKETVDSQLQKIQDQNSKKLDEMRATVDEKLQSSIEARFNESFKLISNRLDQVHQGLGEMQKLATGVGDLKKVLTNVKTRGGLGEIQLGSILEEIFSPEQYNKNSVVKPGTMERVEYTIKLPGKNNDASPVLLPIDSKFPNEDYQRLIEAYENADKSSQKEIEDAKKIFIGSVRKNAKDIREKYINPPVTTDFAIMFVPTEGLYAEILRTTGLFETLQRDYRVTVVGPTNLVAFLSSLQMGFRTLAIEKRSSEVWQILGAVKTQFGEFGKILEKTKKKLIEATNVIDNAGVKSRVIERRLKTVQELSPDEAVTLLGEPIDFEIEDSIANVSTDEEREPELPF